MLSAYPHETLIEIISHFNLEFYFRFIMGHHNIYAGSKVEQGKNLIKMIGNGNGNILLIGDTVHDYEVASEIGADCFLIADGHQCKEKLLQCNVPVFDSLVDLLTYFKKSVN